MEKTAIITQEPTSTMSVAKEPKVPPKDHQPSNNIDCSCCGACNNCCKDESLLWILCCCCVFDGECITAIGETIGACCQ
ncbi:hypothetical protein M3Y98_00826500 [Aphelenchoides besseyi]|nr:hypothetical protein M3Y98_00826500 [Aphelenchoides besseyi]